MTQVLVEPAVLSEGSMLVYKDYDDHIRMAYDPSRIGEDAALDLLRAYVPRLAKGRIRVTHRAGV